MTMKRIRIMETDRFDLAIVSISFWPAEDTAAKLTYDIAVGLARKGMKILVITPNRSYKNPERVFKSKETVENVEIRRVFLDRYIPNKPLSKLMYYLSFGRKASMILQNVEARCYFSTLTPLFVPYKILKLSKIKHKPFIFSLQDLVPDAWVRRKSLSAKNPVYPVLRRQTKELLSNSSRIIVIGRDVKSYIESEYGVPYEKIVIIQNWSRKSTTIHNDGSSVSNNEFTVLYGGTISQAQKLEVIIDAAERVSLRDKSIVFRLIGDGMSKKEMQEEVQKRNLKNVIFEDLKPEAEFRSLIHDSSILLVTLREESKGMSVPSKLYTYLTSGKPILAIVPEESEIDMEIKEDQFGISVSGNSPELIEDAIIKLKEDKEFRERAGKNALKAFENKYNNVIAVDKYYEVIKELLKET
jgi:glycosyltransferase involved in cell wall biosynthesis